MNVILKEINEIIEVCDSLIYAIQHKEDYCSANALSIYIDYKSKIKSFMKKNELIRDDNPLYRTIDSLYSRNSAYTPNIKEAIMIRKLIVELKHTLYPECYEKIFISHREKDYEQVNAFIELLHSIGIPRPTVKKPESVIFCSSHPESYIPNGEQNLNKIKTQFNDDRHMFFILWYTDNYFKSQACLNEAGAIWVMNKPYQEILAPEFDSSQIGGLLDRQRTWFRSNDKFRLNIFREQIEKNFALQPLTINSWEAARDRFVDQINRCNKHEDENNTCM
jgi:hypothetical protein